MRVTEEEILRELDENDLKVDQGNTVGGPFIDDGRVRIYGDDVGVVGEGATLEEAYRDARMRKP